ncbi:MAG: RAMP superfamily CRISPR-associated protein [Ruminococcus sp.]|nr:RAMP superfamily CRISPR-associated protein [Ruminococcus sp.]
MDEEIKKKAKVHISFNLSADGPVLVSSGSKNSIHPERPDNMFLRGMDKGKECYVIPGSSIKGIVKHYLYTIYTDEQIDKLFGYTAKENNLKSCICFYDAYADMDTIRSTIRYSTAVGSVSQSAKTGSLNNLEAVTAGNFKCNIVLKNVTDDEIKMILNAIEAIDVGMIFIGGKVSRGFGKMKVNDFKMILSKGYDENLTPIPCGSYESLQNAVKQYESR